MSKWIQARQWWTIQNQGIQPLTAKHVVCLQLRAEPLLGNCTCSKEAALPKVTLSMAVCILLIQLSKDLDLLLQNVIPVSQHSFHGNELTPLLWQSNSCVNQTLALTNPSFLTPLQVLYLRLLSSLHCSYCSLEYSPINEVNVNFNSGRVFFPGEIDLRQLWNIDDCHFAH